MTALHKAAQTIHPTWLDMIGGEFSKPYMQQLSAFLEQELETGQTIYPPTNDIFKSLQRPADEIRIVILGQDPYHGPGQANGLAFSVHPGIKIPPSLRNIYKEVFNTPGFPAPANGDLSKWSEQGVLLLNSTLTVREAAAGSHQRQGWEEFTSTVIATINSRYDHIVFMLWGSHAQKKGEIIDKNRHLVLEAPHPSPLSAHRGFLGCHHFSKANSYLQKHGLPPVEWASAG